MSLPLPDARILETTVMPNDAGLSVRMLISDGSLDPASGTASGTIRLTLSVQIPAETRATLARIELGAMDLANSVLAALCREKKAGM
jgi:hypothetical protein